jgi:hypothetical protein
VLTVTRDDREVRRELRQESGDLLGRVLQVAVEGDHDIAGRVLQPGEDGWVLPEVPREAHDERRVRELGGKLGGTLCGSVSTPVVDEHELRGTPDAGNGRRESLKEGVEIRDVSLERYDDAEGG